MKEKAKVERLIKSMRLFFDKRHRDGVSFINGWMPPAQKKQMQSIIDQAKKIDSLD